VFYNLIYPFHSTYSFLNVFRYITFRTIYAVITALVISFLIGPWITRVLKQRQIGQTIRSDGPKSHHIKSGTPTMGGLMILIAMLVSTLLWSDMTNQYVWLVLFSTSGFGLIGFWDDYLKCIKKDPKGLLPRYKFGLQILVASITALILHNSPAYATGLSIPFLKNIAPDIGILYIPFAILVIVGASNAVNLTDGLDGLAVGPIMVTAVAYLIVSYVTGHRVFSEYLIIPYIKGAGELAVFCGSILGASLGFLWFNTYPATIFMGDIGSLPLGGALGTVAVISKHELLLALVGGIFVLEALSVIFQVISFKSRGKRIFLMAPIHHHYELKGWKEPKIVVRFWIIAIILGLISLSTLKLR